MDTSDQFLARIESEKGEQYASAMQCAAQGLAFGNLLHLSGLPDDEKANITDKFGDLFALYMSTITAGSGLDSDDLQADSFAYLSLAMTEARDVVKASDDVITRASGRA